MRSGWHGSIGEFLACDREDWIQCLEAHLESSMGEATSRSNRAAWLGTQGAYSGSVTLSLVVDEAGNQQAFVLLLPLGAGLDEAALDAVRKWHPQPGTKNGVPVPVRAIIKVNFRLLQQKPPVSNGEFLHSPSLVLSCYRDTSNSVPYRPLPSTLWMAGSILH